jgi:cobalt-zinc-cadmium efflux system membrane fusion protein
MSRHGRVRRRALAAAWSAMLTAAVIATAAAHDGEIHRDPDAGAPAADAAAALQRPVWLADGSLYVGRELQQRLKLRSQPWSPAAQVLPVQHLAAEVQPQPDAALAVVAIERGRLDAPEGGGWPLPGQQVRAGQLLAWLQPQLSQPQRAERRARLAKLDAELAIADVNVERQQLQSAVNTEAGGVASGNIWVEKYLAERDAMRRNRELLAQSLDDRIALKAPHAGRVLGVVAAPGTVVEAGAAVLRLSDSDALQLSAVHQQAGLGARIAAARLGDGSLLLPRGEEPLADGSGWRLRFDVPAGQSRLLAGQVVDVALAIRPPGQALALPAGVCVDRNGAAEVWLQRGDERFERRRLPSCRPADLQPAVLALVDGDRLVTEGAALLSRYR